MRQEKEELMEEGSPSGASGVFLQCLGRPGAGWLSLAATPSPFCPKTQAGRDGSGRQSPIPRPSGVGKVRVYLHGESGPHVPTLMGRRSNQPSSCSCDKSCTGRWSAHPPVLGDAKEGPVLLPWDTYKTSA